MIAVQPRPPVEEEWVTARLIGGALDGQERQIPPGWRSYIEPVKVADLGRYEASVGWTFGDFYEFQGMVGGEALYRYQGRRAI